jgi:hypothetical protein
VKQRCLRGPAPSCRFEVKQTRVGR